MKYFRIALLLATVVVVSLTVTDLRAQTPTRTATTPTISSRATTINGQSVGQVLIGSTVVIQIYGSAGGYSAGQRADIVAQRLSTQLRQGYGARDVRVRQRNKKNVDLLMGNTVLLTADRTQARANGVTPLQLATTWQRQVQAALPNTSTGGGTGNQWPDWTNAQTKIVPIISLGTPGLRIGAAQITGPRERVSTVNAVLQLDVVFERVARIRAYIPSSSLTSVRRVQGVAVTALLQYQLFRF
ncbi:MAG TPA: hypothetical protein VHV83_05585 [Armatimonadota bacterium]|nr:hypothetical protein [Armatimonadota bacterium]